MACQVWDQISYCFEGADLESRLKFGTMYKHSAKSLNSNR